MLEILNNAIRNYDKIALNKYDFDSFINRVIKDESGNCLCQAQIHKSWTKHVNFCWRNGLHAGILAPFGHGKTTQIVLGRALFHVGENPNIRIKIISNTDTTAGARVRAIKGYLERDNDYNEIFPLIRPKDYRQWTQHKLTVNRLVELIDPSIEARGVTCTGVGGRCDLMIFDDPVDLKNAILVPGDRAKVLECIQNVWLTRLIPDSRVIWIATSWHKEDASQILKKSNNFCFLIQKINPDFNGIDCEVINSPHPKYQKFSLPLWEERWDEKSLRKYANIIGLRAFNRGFRQETYTEEEKTFKSFIQCLDPNMGWQDAWAKTTICSIGIDLASKGRAGTVAFVLGQGDDGKRYPICIERKNLTSPETVKLIKTLCIKFKPRVLVVENNAYQQSLIEWLHENGLHNFTDRIVPFTTGTQKMNPQIGLPSIEIEFERGQWQIPQKDYIDHDSQCNCGFCIWVKEVENYPFSSSTDVLMASWFAREGLRNYCGLEDLSMETLGERNSGSNLENFERENFDEFSLERRGNEWLS